MQNSAFVLRAFEPPDQPACKELVLTGLVEHWGSLDADLNPDLNDIATSYADGLFLTAWRDGELAGTGALLPAGEGCFEVVRVSVARRWRRQGLGQLILSGLEKSAEARGAKRLVLETTSDWHEVIEFYLESGYHITHTHDGDTYFEKSLMANNSPIPPSIELARELAARFSQFPQVQAVALAGSQTSGRADPSSDIDLYVYHNAPIALEERRALVAARGSSRADLDMRFWDLGDEWIDLPSGIEVDIIYWEPAWIEAQLARALEQHLPNVGYSTCFWNTIRKSSALFDRDGWFQGLQTKAAQDYPEALRLAIIETNHALLGRVIPAYSHQIELAVKRGDLVSLNHRIAAYLASYFDVIYALNRELNPGEKRLLSITAARCAKIPRGMVEGVTALLQSAATPGEGLLSELRALTAALDQLLAAEGFDPATGRPVSL
jgi:GNAT superfamily N-acetyltransferase